MTGAPAAPGAATPGTTLLSLSDEAYPPLLRHIPDPPDILYVRGDPALLSQPMIAMVGSRRASAAGLRQAGDLAGAAVRAGLHVCSGMAAGIDGAAHAGALDAGGCSVAVLGTGIDIVYPPRHEALAARLATGGALVSEFPPGTGPRPYNFPRRNRIVSGLCLGVVVVEAALPSGSLITAGTATEQGREVFALPWSSLHAGGRGCLQLLRDGAKMVLDIDDILEELGALYALQCPSTPPAAACTRKESAGEDMDALLTLLGYEAVSLDELVARGAGPVDQLLARLSELEVAGRVTRCAGGYTLT